MFGQSNGLVVQDIFGRNLNSPGLTLVDWDGYMANPAIKFFVIPPSSARFPATAVLTANDQRLYFDRPSTVGPNGPSKTITFANGAPVTVYLGNAPDRDTNDGYYQLTIQFTGADKQSISLTLPVHKIDQDQQSNAPYLINIDFSQDKTGFFGFSPNRVAIQQELTDWAYFIDGMNLDSVPASKETTFIWNPDGFVAGNFVTNSNTYTGYLLYVYGIHSSALRSGGEVSSAGGLQTSNGTQLSLKRSGGVEIETAGNFNSLGWLTSTSDQSWWVSGNLGSEQPELFSISHHESGHAIAFHPSQPNFAVFKGNGCVNDAAVIAYHGSCPKIDSTDHLSGEVDNDSLMGAFGNEYNGVAPARRWFITKLDLLVLQAIGYKLRKTSAFIPPNIITASVASGTLGQMYSQALIAQGGIPFYNWTLASGSLPDGLILNNFSGVISGVPAKLGTLKFTVRLQEYASASVGVTAEFTLTINSQAGCGYSLSSGGQAFGVLGGSSTIDITATQGCSWSASEPPSWVTFTSPTRGTGNGILSYQVAPDTGDPRSSAITIAGLPFTIEQQAASISGLALIGSMPHIAAEENWTTAFSLVNKSTAPAQARLSLFGDPSGLLALPFTFPQQPPATGPLLASSFDRTLAANASLIVTTSGPQIPPVLIGSAEVAATGAVDGFAIFSFLPTKQEAVVPLETRNASSYLLAFDNTNNVVLNVALENVSAQMANVGVVIRDDTGAQLGTGSLSVPGSGHTSFVLPTQFPFTANKRGTIEFDTPSGGRISVLGVRFTPPGTLTTIPALANVGTTGGSISHIASANGWKTTFVLVNAGTSSAQSHLKFFDDNGTPLLLPLAFPQSGGGASSVASVLDRTLAAGATLMIESTGPDTNPLLTGSAQLTTDGNISGFVIFRYNPNGQEAVVPLENRAAGAYLLAFDNTAGIVTGVAVSNASAQAATVPVVIRDDTGAQVGAGSIALVSNGHTAFLLADKFPVTANIRGTIEFDTPPGGNISALGVRTPPTLTFTTLPALAK